jgi:serine/threonine protein kinase
MPHRDLKPSNLLVGRPTPSAPLTLKIADFGIPKPARGATDFSAPELLGPSPAPADHRADLYSLGCVFYFLLAGRAPFAGGTPEERARRRSREEAPPLLQLRPDAPPEVAAVVHRLLAKDPAARFASAAELLGRLEVMCVPVAVPVGGDVCFDLPAGDAGQGTGFLTGREPPPADTPPPADAFDLPPDASPWSQLTDGASGEGETLAAELESPAARRPKPPGRGEAVPGWMTAMLLVAAVLLCLAGIGAVLKLMAK